MIAAIIRSDESTALKSVTAISFSRGFGVYDNHPEQCVVTDAAAFLEMINTDRGRAKGEQYICAPCAIASSDTKHRSMFSTSIGKAHRCSSCISHVVGLDSISTAV